MLVKFNFIAEGSGKAGGLVASRNKGGSYLKSFTMGTNPNTASQAAQRAILSALIAQWRALSTISKNLWNQAGPDYSYVNRVGDTKTRSGYQAFMTVNAQIQAAGGPPFRIGDVVTTPPGLAAPTDLDTTPDIAFAALALPTLEIATVDAGGTNNRFVFWATKPLSSGVSSAPSNAYRVIGYVNDTTTPGTFDLATSYTGKFGAPAAAGQKIGVKIVQVNADTGVTVTILENTYTVS